MNIPQHASHLEVFDIKQTDQGYEAYIGYKINGIDFHFIQVPFTMPSYDYFKYKKELNDLLSKFINSEKYMYDPLFRSVIEMMVRGSNPIQLIEELMNINSELRDTLEKFYLK